MVRGLDAWLQIIENGGQRTEDIRKSNEKKGFSPRNLKYMRAFAEGWPDKSIVQRVVAQY